MPTLSVRQRIVEKLTATTLEIMEPFKPIFWGRTIKVLVGKGELQQEFIIHEDLICQASKFFCNAMKNDWKESQDRVITLPDDDADAFSAYLQFVYSGRSELLWPSRDITITDPSIRAWAHAEDIREENIMIWANTLVLADKLMDILTHMAMVSRFYDTRCQLWDYPILTARAVSLIYENTPGPCGIRQLLVDSQVHHHRIKYSDSHDEWGDIDRNQATLKIEKALDIAQAASKVLPEEFLVDIFLCSAIRGPGDGHQHHGPPCEAFCSPKSQCFHDYREKYLPKSSTEDNIKPRTHEGWLAYGDAGNSKAIRHCDCCAGWNTWETAGNNNWDNGGTDG